MELWEIKAFEKMSSDRFEKLDDRWLRIENISKFLNDTILNAEWNMRPNLEQNEIPRENRLIFDEVMRDQSFW